MSSGGPSTRLKNIFRHLGSCDRVDFNENIIMSTDKDHNFSVIETYKQTMDQDKQDFDNGLIGNTAYAQLMYDEVRNQRKNFNFDLAKNIKNWKKQESKFDLHFKFLDPETFAKINANQALEHLNKNYDFDRILEPYKKTNVGNIKDVKEAISLRHIDMIGEPEFEEQCKHYDDYYEIISNVRSMEMEQKDKFKDIQSYRELTDYLYRCMFVVSILPSEKGIKIGKQSYNFNIDYSHDLRPYRIFTQKISLPSAIDSSKYNITLNEVLCFAGKGYSWSQLQEHLRRQKGKFKQQQKLERQNMLQNQLQQIKQKIKILKQKKRDKNRLKFDDQMTQTQKIIRDEPIKDFIELEDKILLARIENIVAVKDNQIKKGLERELVYQQCHPILRDYLFQLLMIIAAGEKFIEWGAFFQIEDRSELERMVVKILYKNLNLLETSRTAKDGESKIQLLAIYSNYKLMIDKEEKEMSNKDSLRLKKNNAQNQKKIMERNHERSVSDHLHHQKSKHPSFTPTKSPSKFIQTNQFSPSKSASKTNTYKPRLNNTTNQNINTFNKSKNSVAMENMEKRINRLFFNETGNKRKSQSKSHSRSVSKISANNHQQSVNYPMRVRGSLAQGQSHSKSTSKWK